MTREVPLRAQPESRILGHHKIEQASLFDEDDASVENQLLADYRQRYGLSEDPFAQDYSFPLFTGAHRRELLDQLLHLCQFSNSVLVVLGELGVGKTRIAHAFMDSLSDDDQICFLSLTPEHSLENILFGMLDTFDQTVAKEVSNTSSAEDLLDLLEIFINGDDFTDDVSPDEEGLAVVVIDNADYLDDRSISAITHLLSGSSQSSRIHLVLFGAPGLMSRMESLSPEQMLLNDFYLPPLGLGESVDYLNFRMEMADYLGPEIFTESMVEPWWRGAQGQLTVLHKLAQEHLLQSMASPVSNSRPLPLMHIFAITILVTLVGVTVLYMEDDTSQETVTQLTKSPAPVADPISSDTETIMRVSEPVATAVTKNTTATNTQPVQPIEPLLKSLPEPSRATSESAADTPVDPLAHLPGASLKPNEVPIEKKVEMINEPNDTAEKDGARIRQTPSKITANHFASPSHAQEILSWSPSEYTIQLLGVSTQKAALDYVAAQSNKNKLLVFKSKRQAKDWFVVITGHYATSALAREAIKSLPEEQRSRGPWPRDVKTIQKEISSIKN